MKYDGIVIFSDLDGTLLDDGRKLHKDNLDAISRFVSQGGKFAVATGRMEKTTVLNFPQLPINAPSIFFNGALVYDINTEEVLFSSYLPDDLEPMLKDVFSRYPTSGLEINVRGKAYAFNINDIVRAQVKREGVEVVESTWSDIPKNWLKVLFADKHEVLEDIKTELYKYGRKDINIMFSEKELLDIVSADVSKGAALKRLREIHKNEWKLVVALGDNDNDYEMMEQADLAIAVSNALPEVKSVSDHIICHHNIPCMPQVMEILDSHLQHSGLKGKKCW